MTGLSEPAFEKLIKLMQLTGSASDNEILSAVKMSNALLRAAHYNWEDLLRSKVVTFPTEAVDLTPPKSTQRHTNKEEIDGYFRIILSRDLKDGFYDFVCSVQDFWHDKGFLTQKQYDAIKRSALR